MFFDRFHSDNLATRVMSNRYNDKHKDSRDKDEKMKMKMKKKIVDDELNEDELSDFDDVVVGPECDESVESIIKKDKDMTRADPKVALKYKLRRVLPDEMYKDCGSIKSVDVLHKSKSDHKLYRTSGVSANKIVRGPRTPDGLTGKAHEGIDVKLDRISNELADIRKLVEIGGGDNKKLERVSHELDNINKQFAESNDDKEDEIIETEEEEEVVSPPSSREKKGMKGVMRRLSPVTPTRYRDRDRRPRSSHKKKKMDTEPDVIRELFPVAYSDLHSDELRQIAPSDRYSDDRYVPDWMYQNGHQHQPQAQVQAQVQQPPTLYALREQPEPVGDKKEEKKMEDEVIEEQPVYVMNQAVNVNQPVGQIPQMNIMQQAWAQQIYMYQMQHAQHAQQIQQGYVQPIAMQPMVLPMVQPMVQPIVQPVDQAVELPVAGQPGILPCPHCPQIFNDLISLNDHILIYHDNAFAENVYACEVCDLEFGSQIELNGHMKTHFARRLRDDKRMFRALHPPGAPVVPPDRYNDVLDPSVGASGVPGPVGASGVPGPVGPSGVPGPVGMAALPPLPLQRSGTPIRGKPYGELKMERSASKGPFSYRRLERPDKRAQKEDKKVKIKKIGKSEKSDVVEKFSKPQERPKVLMPDNDDLSDTDDDDNDDNMNMMDKQDDPEVDNIPVNPRGRYRCVICGQRYLTEHLLGAHFMIAHGKYDRMLELDNSVHKVGFPGFDIIEYIGMIMKSNEKEITKFVNNKVECPICKEVYRTADPEYKPDDSIQVTDCDSDSEAYDPVVDLFEPVKSDAQMLKQYSNDDANFTLEPVSSVTTKPSWRDRFIREPALVAIMNKHRALTRLPIIVSCCSRHLCTHCMEQTLTNSNQLTCPFCYYDHTKYDMDFIRMYEIGKINKKKWQEWWIRGDKYINILLG